MKISTSYSSKTFTKADKRAAKIYRQSRQNPRGRSWISNKD